MWERCGEGEGSAGDEVWQEQVGRILEEEGEDENWMRGIERERQGTWVGGTEGEEGMNGNEIELGRGEG